MSQRKFKFDGPAGRLCEAVAGINPETDQLFLNVFELAPAESDDELLLWSSTLLGDQTLLSSADAIRVVGGFTAGIPGEWVAAVIADAKSGAAAGDQVSDHTP